MKNGNKPDFLKQLMIAGAFIFFTSTPGDAQNPAPPSSAAETPAPGGTDGNTAGAANPNPSTSTLDNSHTDDDYDGLLNPFGRGCPYADDDLELVS